MTTKPRQTFSAWIHNFGRGALDDELTVALAELASDVQLLSKTGKLTLTLTVAKESNGVVVGYDIKCSAPKTPNSIFHYVDTDGTLTRRDPNQPALPGIEQEVEQ